MEDDIGLLIMTTIIVTVLCIACVVIAVIDCNKEIQIKKFETEMQIYGEQMNEEE